MTHTFRCLLSLGGLIISLHANAQSFEDLDLQEFIEQNFNIQEQNLNYEDLYENLLLLYENPIDLNNTTYSELKSTYLLTSDQISAIQSYITENGVFISLYELLYIEALTPELIEKLLPFITVNANEATSDRRPLIQRILSERNNYFIYRYEQTLEERLGYSPKESIDDSRYLGSPSKHYFRYRVSKTGDFSFGLTSEKDAGEALIWEPNSSRYGMDFWSIHFMLEKLGKWRKIIIGDYQLQFGQGLLYNSGFGAGKGAETITTLERAHLGIRPYTSVIEGGFLRGVAASYAINPNLTLTTFLSSANQDASIRDGEEDFEQYFSSINLSGFHRTESELNRKNILNEKVYGLNLHFQPNTNSQLGLVTSLNRFDLPLQRSNSPSNVFEFLGQQNWNIGLYGSTRIEEFRIFGEGATSKSGGLGFVGGLSTNLSARVIISFMFRSYQRDFHSLRGSAFSEGSRNINESGIYWGIKYTLNRMFYLTAYYDAFKFPWLRFNVDRPSEGSDYLIRLNYSPKSGVNTYIQYRNKKREENTRIVDKSQQLSIGEKEQVLANVNFQVTHRLSMKSRLQFSSFTIDGIKTTGVAIIQDASYSIGELKLSGRMALFDTEGAENRQYAYERDVLYAFSIPAYSGRGIRNYLLAQYTFTRKIDFWLRISRTTFTDRDQIGTSLERIEGNKRTDIKLQLRYKLN